MMKKTICWTLFVLIAALSLAACGGRAPSSPQAQPTEDPLDSVEIPAEYSSLTNPLAEDAQAVAQGESTYSRYCAACHGEMGAGDGPASSSLTPAPKNIAENEDGLSDGYLMWRISEGGLMAPFNSSMPGWKTVLSETEIWQLITYLRTLGE